MPTSRPFLCNSVALSKSPSGQIWDPKEAIFRASEGAPAQSLITHPSLQSTCTTEIGIRRLYEIKL